MCIMFFSSSMRIWIFLNLFVSSGYKYQGNGRAFCAGGDVSAVVLSAKEGMFYPCCLMDHKINHQYSMHG